MSKQISEHWNDVQHPTTDGSVLHLSSLKVKLYRGLLQDEAWGTVLAQIAEMLGAEGVWLLGGGHGGWSIHAASFRTSREAVERSEAALFELEREIEKWLVDDEPLVIDDAALDPRIDASIAARCGIRSLIVIPLTSHGERVGTLYISASRPHALYHAHVSELREIADAVAYRMSNEVVIRRLQQKSSLHQAIAEATRVMLSELDLRPTLQLIVDLAQGLTGRICRSACWIALHGEEDGRELELEVPAVQGISAGEVRDLLSRLNTWPITDICTVRVPYGNYKLVTIMPITASGTVLGSLGVAADDDILNDSTAYRVLQTFSRLAALAIYKGRMERKLEASLAETVQALVGALEARNPDISGHCHRVSYYVGRLGEHVGADPVEVRHLVFAGLLHDIGKIALPQHLLRSRERFAPQEWEIIRQHALIGSQIIAGIHGLEPLVPIVRHQYERYDGTGWPSGLRGLAIPRGSRALAVADTFDALMSRQPRRPGHPLDRAMALLKEDAGTKLDPHLVAAFLEIAPAAATKFLPAYEKPLPSFEAALALPTSDAAGRTHPSQAAESDGDVEDLTPRERQVLSLIGLGLSNKEIATRLVLSEKTVKTHVMHIFQKLGVQDRTRAALYAFSRGLVAPKSEEHAEERPAEPPHFGL